MRLSIRTALIGALLGAVLVSALAVGLTAYLSARQQLTDLARANLWAMATWTVEQAEAYLTPARQAGSLALGLAERHAGVTDAAATEQVFLDHLAMFPQLTALSFRDSAGGYIRVSRSDSRALGGFLTRRIIGTADGGRIELTWRDADRHIIHRFADEAGSALPSVPRPWYLGTDAAQRQVWSEPRMLPDRQRPGISTAMPVIDVARGVRGILSVDLDITGLDLLLNRTRHQHMGAAVIVEPDGTMIAGSAQAPRPSGPTSAADPVGFPAPGAVTEPADGDPLRRLLDEIEQGVPMDGPVFASFKHGDMDYHALVAPFGDPRMTWLVGVYLPQKAYFGAVANGRNLGIVLALITGGLAVWLAARLTRSFTTPLAGLRAQAAGIRKRVYDQLLPRRMLFRELYDTANAVDAMRRSLHHDEERRLLAASGAHDGLIDIDTASGAAYFSSRLHGILGLPDGRLGNALETWLARLHIEDAAAVTEAFENFQAAEWDNLDLECRVRHGQGGYRWVHVRGNALRGPDGRATRVVVLVADVTARKQAEARLLHEALHDALTGLPNRVAFMECLEESLERVKAGAADASAVLFIDLDRFKTINDGLGQAAGDDMLIAVARRLTAAAGGRSLVARMGSDQFAVLTAGIGDPVLDGGDAADAPGSVSGIGVRGRCASRSTSR